MAQSPPPVLLVPGLMAGDWSMLPLARRLSREGYPIVRARIGINIGCTTELVERLEMRLEDAFRRYGRRPAIVGWSRGGTLAKIVTIRRPELVAGLITLGSPNVDPLAVSRTVLLQLRLLNRLQSVGLRGLLGVDCLEGECAKAMGMVLRSPFPAQIPYIAFFSKSDGVVDWRACCDPAAELIEVRASHFQLGMHPRVLRLVSQRLAGMQSRQLAAAS